MSGRSPAAEETTTAVEDRETPAELTWPSVERSTPEKNAGDRMEPSVSRVWARLRSRACRTRRLADGVLGHPKGDPGTERGREDHLVQLITGVYKPSAGDIYLFGEDVTATAAHGRGWGLVAPSRSPTCSLR